MEPTLPSAAASTLVDGTDDGRPGSSNSLEAVRTFKSWQKWRRVVGLLLLALTVFLWTASNFLASSIFADDTYSKPYFVTYVNTAFFIVPLVPIMLRKTHNHPEEFRQFSQDLRQWYGSWRFRGSYMPLAEHDETADGSQYADSPRDRRRRQSMSASEELLLGEPAIKSDAAIGATSPEPSATHEKLSLWETSWLSLKFCIIWFLANYFAGACLQYTTVASATILTSTSSVFTLVFGAALKVEKFTLRKLCGVILSVSGIVLVSMIDISGDNTDEDHRGDFPEKSSQEIFLGDTLAFLSAVMYGLYAAYLKKRIEDESRVSMPLFFGLVGFMNVVLLWPGFIILHFTGVEQFQLPPTSFVATVIVCNSLASLVSDMAWAYAVLLTSPIVVTVGLSMTIPVSLLGQNITHGQHASWLYWLGAVVVVISFLFVDQEERKEEEVQNQVTAAAKQADQDLTGSQMLNPDAETNMAR